MYAETKSAFIYLLNTRDYDRSKMQSMIQSAYSNAFPSEASCRQIEADGYQIIAIANRIMSDEKDAQNELKEAVREFNKSMSKHKPIYCNTIGSMTTCN